MTTDQTSRTPRLTRVFAGRSYHSVGFIMQRRLFVFNCIFNHITDGKSASKWMLLDLNLSERVPLVSKFHFDYQNLKYS